MQCNRGWLNSLDCAVLHQGYAAFIPSPRRGRARVGVKVWQAAIVAYQHAHPHPNLPPVRGKGLVVAAMQCIVIKRVALMQNN